MADVAAAVNVDEEQAPTIEELLYTVAEALVEEWRSVCVTRAELAQENVLVFNICAQKSDVKFLIGKQGQTISALRVIAAAVGARTGKKIKLEIVENKQEPLVARAR
jgi:hypothetical protein